MTVSVGVKATERWRVERRSLEDIERPRVYVNENSRGPGNAMRERAGGGRTKRGRFSLRLPLENVYVTRGLAHD